ncbi:MAG TPA: hypothetical protein VFB32_13610, partial [Rudaea sp.]|nr:hypothetical protein [Rudaea sp.]
FAWQDLNVYSIGWSLLDDSSGLWTLRYSTREQPMPTSPLLQIALAPYMSSHDIEFAFSHPFGAASNLRFAATYAPTQFLLGGPTSYSLRNNFGSSQLEYEALWTTRF